MDSPGRIIENPISGERIVIRVTAAQSAGELLAFDLFLPPGGHVPAGHVHPVQEERFTIVAGEWRFKLGRRSILVGPGQTVLVPSGAAHWFGNIGETPGQARVEVRPALRTEELLELSESVSRAARAAGRRLPSVHDLALMLLEFQLELAVPHVPAGLMRFGLKPVAWLARRRRSAISAEPLQP